MESDRGPVVNLYNAARAELVDAQGDSLSLRIETDFPLSDRVSCGSIRMPASLHVVAAHSVVERTDRRQSQRQKGPERRAGRLPLPRTIWKPGDRVELAFDMRCRLLDAPRGRQPGRRLVQALVWGPIVLARNENIDPDYDEPVRVVAGKDRVVRVKRVAPTLALDAAGVRGPDGRRADPDDRLRLGEQIGGSYRLYMAAGEVARTGAADRLPEQSPRFGDRAGKPFAGRSRQCRDILFTFLMESRESPDKSAYFCNAVFSYL